eukprot:8939429-Prorocentrum_lima.AAC.1
MNQRIEELTQALAERDHEVEEPPWGDEAALPDANAEGFPDDLLSGTPTLAGGIPDPIYVGGPS